MALAALSGLISCSHLLISSPAYAQVAQIDIPAGDAGKSVAELARQTGILVIAPGAQLQGITTPPLKGTYDAVAALELMLKGTGLEVSRSTDGIVRISLPKQKTQEESADMLNEHKATVSIFALLFGALGGQADAQTDQQLETVVVTGVRASLQSAQEIKKQSSQIVDSIVAEDIGKLPDNNVIEALQHVSGVQVSRNASEASQLLIRGLPDVATLMNGREIFTSTGRYMSLQDVPAELLARVDVHKSASASDLEGGIAGVIDVRLHRPFDFDGLQIAGSARGTYSSLSGHVDPQGSALLSNRWQTGIGEIGALLDVSYSKDHYKEEIMDNYISSQSTTVNGTTAYMPLTQGAQSINGRRERAAVDFSTQWRPNTNTEVYAEIFYTRYRNPNSNDFLVGLPWMNADSSTATLFPNSNEVKTVSGGGYELTSDQSYRAKTDTYQAASGMTWTGDRLTLRTELDYTSSSYYNTGYILDTEFYPPSGGYTADMNYNGTGTPYINVTGVDLTSPATYHVRQWYDQWTEQKGNEINISIDANYDMHNRFLQSIDAGFRYGNRYAQNRADDSGGLDCRGTADQSSPSYARMVAALASTACTTFPSLDTGVLQGSGHVTSGSQFDGAFGISKWMDADPDWLVSHVGDVRELFGQSRSAPAADPTQSFDDREQSFAAYAKANLGFDLWDIPVDGNIGLRVVDVKATTKAYTLIVTNTGTTADPSYTFSYESANSSKETADWMPSINLRAKIRDDFFIRVAASRTVTRPTFSQLNPGLSLSASTATLLGSGSSGNPDLRPVKSDNVDMTFEYYFGSSNMLTASLFYREVDGYIGTYNTEREIGGITYQVSEPQNGSSGHIDGMEVNYQQFFDFLPGWLSGFGVQANGTYVDGKFQNISKYSYNLVGIYERGPFSLRVAYNWRSSFSEGAASGGGQNPDTIYAKSQPWLDLSASYKYNQRLTFTFDATNLLDSYFQDSFGKGALGAIYPRDTRRFDQTISLGVRYKL